MITLKRCLLSLNFAAMLLINVSGFAAELVRVPLGIIPVGEQSTTYITYKAGFFKKNGLDVDPVYFQSGSQVMQAMLAGHVPLTTNAGPEGVVARLQGADIILLSTNSPLFAMALLVSPEIKKPEDLRGKKAGISRFGSSSDYAIRFMLRKLGLAEKDVTILEIGENPTRVAALKANAVQAAVFAAPYTVTVKKAGFISMLEGYEMDVKFHGAGIATTKTFLKSDRSTVEQFFKGFLEGIHYAKTHKDDSIRLIKEFLKIKEQDEAEESYRVFIKEILPSKPYPHKEAIETVLDIVKKTIPKASAVKVEDLYDDSIIRKIDESGFIDKLYK